MIKDEKIHLIQCAREGFRLLGGFFKMRDTGYFSEGSFFRADNELPDFAGRFLPTENPDAFYLQLGVIALGFDRAALKDIIQQQNRAEDIERAADAIEMADYKESRFERNLTTAVDQYSKLDDAELRASFLSRITVSPSEILDLQTDQSLFYAKINHGYWEYMRDVYASVDLAPDRFRDINTARMSRRLRTSGATQFWGYQLNRIMGSNGAVDPTGPVIFAISLSAGTELPAKSIKKPLNQIVRGAAAGVLSMMDTVSDSGRYTVGDGGTPRSLVAHGKLGAFFDKFVSDSEACVFLVPKHLKDIILAPAYRGDVFRFLVPHSRIPEAWKPLAAGFIGYLRALAGRYRSICVLAQGASIASLLGLLMAELADEFPGVRLRFFDMGRILDLATPEVLKNQHWLGKFEEEFIAEGRKIFKLDPAENVALASIVH